MYMPQFSSVHSANIQVVAIAISLGLFFGVVELIRRDRLREEYALIWLISSAVFLLFSIWRSGFDAIAAALGIAYGPSLLLLVILVAGFALMVHFSIIVSHHSEQGKRLSQELAVSRVSGETNSADDPTGRALAIVPAYNEHDSLRGVIDDIRAHAPGVDIAVVDDASTDETAQIARDAGVVLLPLPVNLGIGGAVQTGFRYAYRKGYGVALQVDGDGQHAADQIDRLLAPIREGGADAVIGSRFLEGDGFQSTAARRLGIRAFSWITRWTAGVTVRDATSGFRAYTHQAVGFLAESYARDYPEVEAITTLARNHYRILEVPVTMRERQGGASSISTPGSLYYLVKVTLAALVSSIKPRGERARY